MQSLCETNAISWQIIRHDRWGNGEGVELCNSHQFFLEPVLMASSKKENLRLSTFWQLGS